MAIELEPERIRVNAAPWLRQDKLQRLCGPETAEEGAREAVRVALLGPNGPTGTFNPRETRNAPVVIGKYGMN